MTDQHENGSSSSSSAFEESSAVELNVKTLDSRVYSFQVEKTIPISLFKEEIANRVGIPVGQQRLIFRGKVLKDEHTLSEYQVENGDTLHLVERQQPQPQSDTNTREASGNNNNRGTSDVPHNHIGQIAPSVILGSFNVGGQGEAMGPDVGRVIGGFLNSFGIGQTATNVTTGPMSFTPPNASGQVSDQNGNGGAQREGGTQAQSGQAYGSQPFHSMPQVVQIPLASAAIPVPLASLETPIPDSLNTMSEFMNRMEQSLTQDGYQPNSPLTDTGDISSVELSSNEQGMPTTEALSTVLRHAEQFLNSRASAALTHLAGRLEREGISSDSGTRNQIQTEAMQIGLAMQHIGTLLLELGRTIMTLRMGQSPAEPFVNAGPAIYISPTGPNPIMVQPSPLLASSFFGGPIPSFNPVTSGPVGFGNPPRNVSIHIHAGTSLAPMVSTVGSRAGSGEGAQRESGNAAGAARMIPVRIAASVPQHPTGVAISSTAQPSPVVSASQPSAPVSISSFVTGLNAQLRNLVGNIQEENHSQSGAGQQRSTSSNLVVGSSAEVGSDQQRNTSSLGVQGLGASLPEGTDNSAQKVTTREDCSASSSAHITTASSGGSLGDLNKGTEDKINDAIASKVMRSNEKNDIPGSARLAPLGLGLGGLERKRSSKQPKSNGNGVTSVHEHDQNARVGQQVLQALASCSSSTNRRDSNDLSIGQSPIDIEQSAVTRPGRRGSDGPFDMACTMSQVLQSPALNGLLGGVSGQAGVGSSDALRNMMQQFTQSPAMMDAVNQIAQQVDEQEIENMFAGTGRNQGGGLDLSGMIQQMMPVVTRALSGSRNPSQQSPVLPSEHHQLQERKVARDGKLDQKVNLQEVVQSIQHMNSPEEIFRSMIESAVRLYGSERVSEDFINELCSDNGLASAYMEMLVNDLSKRLQED